MPPSDLSPPPGIQADTTEEPPKWESPKPPSPTLPKIPDIRYFDVPGTELEVPLPSNEILVTAGTTATVSVVATLTATAVFKRTVQVLKPIVKKLLTRKKE